MSLPSLLSLLFVRLGLGCWILIIDALHARLQLTTLAGHLREARPGSTAVSISVPEPAGLGRLVRHDRRACEVLLPITGRPGHRPVHRAAEPRDHRTLVVHRRVVS